MAEHAISLEPTTTQAHSSDRSRAMLTVPALAPGYLWLLSFATLVVMARIHGGAWPISPEPGRHPTLGSPLEIEHSIESQHWLPVWCATWFFALTGAPAMFLASLSIFSIRSKARFRVVRRVYAGLVCGLVIACAVGGGEWIAWWLDA